MKFSGMIVSIAALAASASVFAESAVIDEEAGLCGAFIDTGELVVTEDTRVVSTRSKNSNVHLKCLFDASPTVDGNAYVDEGFLCGVYDFEGNLFITAKSHVTQTPDGRVTLICHASD